ncbi:MAG: aminotransferase class V-fold PLP-dependent enzyme [Cytophagales bacterium]|nr:aminotransferase class V-fold PLP-dependent enzyme [Cytophagales bacterium]
MLMIEEIKELERISRLLDPPEKKRIEWTNHVTTHANKFLSRLENNKAYLQNEDQGAGILKYDIEEEPSELSNLLQSFESHIQNDGINAASAGHMGYIPGGGLYPSALGDYLAAVSNKYAGIFYPAPGAVRLENLLIRWMNRLMGFPESSGGNLTSGGSISNLIAIVTAREAAEIKSKDFHRLVVYISDESHHSLPKALKIAGLGEAQLRHIPLDAELRMRTDHLDEIIEEDAKNGLLPFFINGSLGTTNTGTIDPINMLANIARKHNLWFHVDAAYGGFFKLIPELKDKFNGIEKADSITLDPHKSLFLPFGTGAVLIKDVKAMHQGHQYTADYLQDLVDSDDEINPADVSPELTKHFRGMRMWLPMKLFGLKPFRAALREKLLLAQYFNEQIKKVPKFECGGKPDLSVALFRYVPDKYDANIFNQKLIRAIQDDGRIFLSSTTINGTFWIRVAVLVFRTHLRHVDLLLEILQEKVDLITNE